MTLNDDLRLYLPKYLSSESQKELFSGLKDFPDNLEGRYYTSYLKDFEVIFQGDGIKDLIAIDLPNPAIKKVPSIVLSNTCDVEIQNIRNFKSRLIYSPIISLRKYRSMLISELSKPEHEIDNHIDTIKKQQITQIFYLPEFKPVIEESIIFLDRIFNIDNDYIPRNQLSNLRLFSLSDFGNYLFILKLSIHFTRIQDKVERRSTRI